MEKQEPVYVGIAKERNGPYGTMLSIALTDECMRKLNAEWDRKGRTGYVNLTVTKRQAPSDKGVTHKVVINQWEPTGVSKQSVPVVHERKVNAYAAGSTKEERVARSAAAVISDKYDGMREIDAVFGANRHGNEEVL